MDWDDSDDDANDQSLLNPNEIQSLTSHLNGVLFHFLLFLDHMELKRSAESLEMAVQEMVELTHLETGNEKRGMFKMECSELVRLPGFANLDFGRTSNRRSDLSALAFNSYVGLSKICNPRHGDMKKTARMTRLA